MGGRGAGANIPESKPGKVSIKNERPANNAIMKDFISSKVGAIADFPELQGHIYDRLTKVTMAEISGKTQGAYSASHKKIIIDSRLTPDRQRHVAAHELAHALQQASPKSFNTPKKAVQLAYKEWKKQGNKGNMTTFMSRISRYSTKAFDEAHAEAFGQVSQRGKNATPEAILVMKYWKRRR